MIYTVLDYLENSEKMYPEKTAFVCNELGITYNQLYKKVLRTATWINNNFQATRKPIVIMMKNTNEALASFLGVAYSGNIYVPLAADLPLDRIKTIVDILDPICVINCEEYREEYNRVFECPIVSWEETQDMEVKLEEIRKKKEQIIDTDPLYILFTSGSTGIPKGVVISHRAVIDFVEEASVAMGFTENEKFLNQAPFYFDASVPDIYCTLRNGATLHMVDNKMFSFPIKLLEYISEKSISAIYWVPSALVLVANLKALGKRDVSCLKKIMFCGEVMPTKQLNMWKKALPDAKYVNYYGPSEATYASSYYIIDRHFENDEALPIGKAAKNTALILVADGKEVVKAGEIGEIYIQGSGLALGYYNDYEKTKESFVQNPLHSNYPDIVYKTGDLAHYDQEGNIFYDGRVDYQIKHMGYRIELGEIETHMYAMEDVQQAACIYSERKNAIVCFYKGQARQEDILSRLKVKLPAYMIPSQIYCIEIFPMNSNGKTDRNKLKELFDQE